MLVSPFSISRLPSIVFGQGQIKQLPALLRQFGQHALVVTGARSFRQSSNWDRLIQGLAEVGIGFDQLTVSGEPSPAVVGTAIKGIDGPM